jgi:hypothetical protein
MNGSDDGTNGRQGVEKEDEHLIQGASSSSHDAGASSFPPAATPMYNQQQQPAWADPHYRTSTRFAARHPRAIIGVLAAVVVLGLSLLATTSDVQNSDFAKNLSHSVYTLKQQAFGDDSTTAYSRCNPFELEGSVRNDANIDKVHWHPFDSASCPSSNLLTPEFRKNGQAPWLDGRNHTIVLIGRLT